MCQVSAVSAGGQQSS